MEGLPGLSHMIEANVRCDLWARRAVLVGHVNDGLSDVRPASEPASARDRVSVVARSGKCGNVARRSKAKTVCDPATRE